MKIRILFLVVLLAHGASVFAQVRGEVPVYSLDDCLRLTIANNYDIKAASAATISASASLTQAFGNYLPSADINASYSRQLTNLRPQISFINGIPVAGNPVPNSYSMNAGMNWVIFDGLRREAQYDAARNNLSAADNDLRYTRLEAQYKVTRQYLTVLQNMQLLKARRDQVDLSSFTLDRVKAFYDAGRSPITQLYSQETEVANQESALIQAENDVDNAKATLLQLMSLNPTMPAEFVEASIPSEAASVEVESFRQFIGNEEGSVMRALASRPDIAAADLRVNSAAAGITNARSTYMPSVNANGGYAWRNSEIADFDRQGQMYVGLTLRVPLFDKFQTNANIESATLTLTRNQIERQKLELQIRTTVKSSYLNLAASEKGLGVTERALKAADLNYEAARERFNVGSATLLDVQTANNQLITARINRIGAVYTYYDARTLVEFATGLFRER